MQKNYFICFLTLITILFAGGRGEAFVPKAPHLLYLVVEKIGMPTAMRVSQTRQVVPAPLNDGGGKTEEMAPKIESDIIGNAIKDTIAAEIMSLSENVTYAFPDRLHAEIHNDEIHQFYVLSDNRFVKVENGRITGLEPGPNEYYIDPLLYRDHKKLMAVLVGRDINTEKVTLQRLDGEICWVIGEPAFGGQENPGLWVGKDNFFPKRYLLKRAGRTIDIRYADWNQVSRCWCPRKISIFMDGTLFAKIEVDNMTLTSKVPNSLFDINEIRERYPHRSVVSDVQDNNRVDGIDRVDTFNE